jgi:hypothetical protein
MRVTVDFQDEAVEFELPSERLVASWHGPPGVGPDEQAAAIRGALDNPRDFPPLRKIVVPGDSVVIAWDPAVPGAASVLETLGEILAQAGIEAGGFQVLAPHNGPGMLANASRTGPAHVVHDPGDRAQLAYLATTKEGRRVYLNRLLTDADVVIPVGRLGYDSLRGYHGPWSVLFPELSDRDSMLALRDRKCDPADEVPRGEAQALLDESLEVSWLLGTQFHVGLLPGATGLLEAVAGRDTSVRARGIASLEHHWTFQAPGRAELVLAGVGFPGRAATLRDLADALGTATRLVQHGGKIVILSRASGVLGPAVQRLMTASDARDATAALRGVQDAEDYPVARRLALALAWADVFLLSDLDPQDVEALSIVALDRPDQARRLVATCGSASFVSQAEFTRTHVVGEDEN